MTMFLRAKKKPWEDSDEEEKKPKSKTKKQMKKAPVFPSSDEDSGSEEKGRSLSLIA